MPALEMDIPLLPKGVASAADLGRVARERRRRMMGQTLCPVVRRPSPEAGAEIAAPSSAPQAAEPSQPEPQPSAELLDLPPPRRSADPMPCTRKVAARAALGPAPDEPGARQAVAEDAGTLAARRLGGELPGLCAHGEDDADLPAPPLVIRVRDIMDVACAGYGISRTDLISHRRSRLLVEARHVVMWLAKTYTAHSFPTIGKIIGGRDHTTVMFGVYKIDAQRKLDGRLATNLAVLAQRLTGGRA